MLNLIEAVEVHPRRRWTPLIGFALEFTALSAMLLIPLLYPRGLPDAFTRRRVFLPAASDQARPPFVHEHEPFGHSLGLNPLVVVVPRHVTYDPQASRDPTGESVAPPIDGQLLANGDGVFRSIMGEAARLMPPPPVLPHLPRRSVMMEGNLLHRVAPQYPIIAKQMGIQGSVVIKAVISRTGTIEQAQVVSGQPLLSGAALNAVRQWKYRPYYLNGQALEVETQITVNFVLER